MNFFSLYRKHKYKCLQYVINQIVNMRLRISLSLKAAVIDWFVFLYFFCHFKLENVMTAYSLPPTFHFVHLFFFLISCEQCSLYCKIVTQQCSWTICVSVFLYLLISSPYTEPCMCWILTWDPVASFAVSVMHSLVNSNMNLTDVSAVKDSKNFILCISKKNKKRGKTKAPLGKNTWVQIST